MIYNVINMITIILGALLGGFAGKKISKDQIYSMLTIVNITIAIIGIQGAIATQNSILMIISLSVGGLIGSTLDFSGKLDNLGDKLQKKIKLGNEKFSEGLIIVVMIQAVGSLAILGPLGVAINGDPSLIIFKSILDFTSSLIYSTTYGSGLALSAIVVFIYQSIIYFLAELINPLITPDVALEISAIGSVLIFALSLDLLEIKKVKIINYILALTGPIIYHLITQFI